jgi:diguanylate cyclase
MKPVDTQATVIKRADEAMYEAKRSGKNRVVQV